MPSGRALAYAALMSIDESLAAALDGVSDPISGQGLIAAKRAGLIEFDDAGEAYETLYGLVVKDWHVRMLLGEDMSERAKSFGPRARKAVSAFLRLYGTNKGMAG